MVPKEQIELRKLGAAMAYNQNLISFEQYQAMLHAANKLEQQLDKKNEVNEQTKIKVLKLMSV